MSASETHAMNEELQALRNRVKELETKYSYAIEMLHGLRTKAELHINYGVSSNGFFKFDVQDIVNVAEELKKVYKGPTNPSRFMHSPEAEATAGAFCEKHNELHKGKYQGAIGGALTFTFTDTSIGQIQNVECYCGDKECINGDEL